MQTRENEDDNESFTPEMSLRLRAVSKDRIKNLYNNHEKVSLRDLLSDFTDRLALS